MSFGISTKYISSLPRRARSSAANIKVSSFYKLVFFNAFLCLNVSSVQAADDFIVNDSSINYKASQPLTYSLNMGENSSTLDVGNEVTIHIGDHIVLRSDNSKISFTPLQVVVASHGEVVQSAKKVMGFKLPEIYQSVSTLYLSTKQVGQTSTNTCEVIILHKLLDGTRLTQLIRILDKQNLTYAQEESVVRVDCAKRGQN